MTIKNKSLTLSILKRLDTKKYNKIKEITLSNGYTLQLDLKFRFSEMEKVFNKMLEINKFISETEDEPLKNSYLLERYSMFLLMLHFTSLKNIKTKNINEELQIINLLIDSNLYKEILQYMEEYCGEEIEIFTKKMFEFMQERIDSLKQQEEFFNAFNNEMDKVELDDNNETVKQEQQGSDDNSLSQNPIRTNTEEITTEN